MAATVSVVHFNSKVLQSNNNQNSGNNNGASQDSGGGGRREVIILRKASHPPHILPATAAIADGKSLSERKDAGEILISNHGSSRKKQGKDLRTAPQPVAVARRNARERNRVKQVNNGFANLRQHIPSFIAQAFESNTRGGSKKLSKVETLRMAVEYIRSLEDLLAEDNSSSPTSHQSLPSISMLSDDDDSESLGGTTPHQHHHHHQHPLQQYTYQLSHLVYSDDNSENLEPIDSLMMQDGLMEFRGVQDLALLHQGLSNNDSLSPGMYSEQSLSPPLSQHPSDGMVVLRTGTEGEGEVWREIKQEQVELPVISLKSEQELQHHHQKTEIIDVMQWWEAQSPPSSS